MLCNLQFSMIYLYFDNYEKNFTSYLMIIHAVNIHTGGGKVLLDQLLANKTFGEPEVLICDARYTLPNELNSSFKIFKINPSLISRLKAEFLLRNLSKEYKNSTILCFGNLPPIFKLKNEVVLYLQNALLLPTSPFFAQNLKAALRLIYEICWIKFFIKNVDAIWVQTESMKEGVKSFKIPTTVKPFLPTLPSNDSFVSKKYDFISVTGSAPHKRLKILLETWVLFGEKAPKLLIVTDTLTEELSKLIQQIPKSSIEVKVNIPRNEIFQLYNESKALILTSKLESFCLPLYEAHHFNLKIFGPDEPYVRDFGSINVTINLSSKHAFKQCIELALKASTSNE